MNLLIEENEDEQIYFRLLKLKLNIISLKHISTSIYLNGIYQKDENIIATEKNPQGEFLLHFGNKYQKNNILNISDITKIKLNEINGNKYLGNKKLVKIDFYFSELNDKYNIYYFSLPSQKKFFNKKTNYNHSEEKELKDETQIEKNEKIYINDIASQSSSLSTSSTKGFFIRNKTERKHSNNSEDISNLFSTIKLIIYFSLFIFLLSTIIEIIILLFSHSHLLKITKLYWLLSDYYQYFNRVFFSIQALTCIGKSPYSVDCISFIEEISYFNNTNFINTKELIFNQQKILTHLMEENVKSINELLININDKNILQYFKGNAFHYTINQNYENNSNSYIFTASKNVISFNDYLLLTASRYSILSQNFEEINSPVYLLNKTDENEKVFNNINKKNKLNPYQERFYLLQLDNTPLYLYLSDTILQLEKNVFGEKNKLKKLIVIIIIINFILYIIILIILFGYCCFFLVIIFSILKNINNFINEKFEKTDIKQIMNEKIEKLKLMLSFYENNIISIVNDLNSIYNNYKENYYLKIKDDAMFNKKENKNEKNKDNAIMEYIKFIKFRYFNIFIKYSKKKQIYIYSFICLIIIILALFLILLIIWMNFFIFDENVSIWVDLSHESHSSVGDIIANIMIMIFTNRTYSEVSSHLITKDFTADIYMKLVNFYEIEKQKNKISNFFLENEKEIIYECDKFYYSLDNELFNKIKDIYAIRNETNKLFNTYISFCENTHIMHLKNDKTTFFQLVNPLDETMQNLRNENYTIIFDILGKSQFKWVENIFLLLHIDILKIMYDNIQNIFFADITEIKIKIIWSGIIFLIIFVALDIIILLGFVYNINNECKNFLQLKKIFKVCNINE